MTRFLPVLLLALVACGVSRPAPPPLDGPVGSRPPEWEVSQWFNSPPLSLAELRGQVVFVRWFTSPDCPFGTGSAPALRDLHERYAARGLVVVGLYHHKSPGALDPEDVRGWATHYGYTFPIGIDADWRTLKRWWFDGRPERDFTSVSFLIDRSGTVQYVHSGGLIELGSAEYAGIQQRVERLLAEPAARAAR